MNNRSLTSLLAGMVLAFILLASGQLQAQSTIEKCNCKYVTIAVDANVACKVNFVFIYPSQQFNDIITVAPGTKIQVPCEEGTEVTIVDCLNRKNYLGADGCVHNFPADAGCCVDACLTMGRDGCYTLEVKPSFLRCRCL
jgi:hypothetical protein